MRILVNTLLAITALVFTVLALSFAERVFISPPVESYIIQNKADKLVPESIQIEVLNGTKTDELAAGVTSYLRKRGFDVLRSDNWKNADVQTSFIYDRLGNRRASLKVAYALGISDSLVISNIDSSLFLNSTVILGSDYRKLKSYK